MRIDLLDVGRTRYGDCILVRHGGRSILIDGAHPGDTALIRKQLKALLGHAAPFEVDLLVVTHCHQDHIGCLPALVAAGDLTAKTALVADEKLGWGRPNDDSGPPLGADLPPGQRRLVAALQEEDHSDLPDAELERFLQDVTLEEKYADMLAALDEQGTAVVRYGKVPAAKIGKIEAAFADFGLKVLGPTKTQLAKCADVIAAATDAIFAAVAGSGVADDAGPSGLARAYRALARRVASDEFAADLAGPGAAKNDQSIVLKVKADGWAALLTGDMQFAEAQVPGLDGMMAKLRGKVANAGPYAFVKLSHHTSYNGVDASLLDEWPGAKLLAHTGGSNDPKHPDPEVLELLKSRGDQLIFARTDHNGLITVQKVGGEVTVEIEKGELNDFEANQPPDEPAPPEEAEGREAPRPARPVVERSDDGDTVEVIARIPHRATKVTLTIQVEPGGAATAGPEKPPRGAAVPGKTKPPPPDPRPATSAAGGGFRVAGGRPLPKLLFVTCRPKLEANIGAAEAGRVIQALRDTAGAAVVDIPPADDTAEKAAARVRPRLATGAFAGVVLLGGFDVVPAMRLDVLDPKSRRELEAEGLDDRDADSFVVWSDEAYADRDGDTLAELPVSRVPDGRRADVVFAALQAPAFAPGRRFGVRNVHRPFAKGVFPSLPGQGELLTSEPTAPADVAAGAASGAVYYMLHGSARDAARFWGETADGEAFEAVEVENVPGESAGSVVFTGCCWGALSMGPPAARARPDTPLRPRGPEASLAVAYLRAGALAFVGCTGSHYSPLLSPYDYFGKPLHDAFWAELAAGRPPAEALFLARKEFARRMPHGRTDRFSQAVEVKIFRQFTCLGLGW